LAPRILPLRVENGEPSPITAVAAADLFIKSLLLLDMV
jgi:hypothetical protein